MQYRITTPGPLLDENGRLIEKGYALSQIRSYDRARVKASPLRLKEWDYYCICTDRFALALTVADNGYMTMDSISLLDFDIGSQVTTSRMSLPCIAKRDLPFSSASGDIRIRRNGYEICFDNDGKTRHLHGYMDNFSGENGISFDVTLTDAPDETMVIATPFPDKPAAFYYNQKINCMRADGTVRFKNKEYRFDPAKDFGVLDWGRGVWTYDNTWYWGSASGLAGGVPFGFNIGYGFGDTSAASENMLFYNGKAHKLSRVEFEIPVRGGQDDFMSPWKFSSDDGRFEMDFVPVMDRCAKIDLKLICSDQHQVFGRFSGTAVLDDGQKVEIKDLTGFAEKVRNKLVNCFFRGSGSQSAGESPQCAPPHGGTGVSSVRRDHPGIPCPGYRKTAGSQAGQSSALLFS